MATNDKFTRAMLEILDKLLQQHGQNTHLLSEMKSNLSDLRSESRDILSNIKDKLPDTFAREQDITYEKISNLIEEVESNTNKLNETLENYESEIQILKTNINNSCEILNTNSVIIKNIHDLLVEKETQKQEIITTLNNVDSFIAGMRSKRMWIVAIVTGIAALATAFSSLVGAWEKFSNQNNKHVVEEKQNEKP